MVLLYIAVALIVIIGILFMIPAYTKPFIDRHGHKVKGSIALLEKVILGGVEQWILIRGEDTTKPLILFLHGGPGTAEMGVIRRHKKELEKHFVVVTWDQRGAGKSYRSGHPHSEMKISRFVSDTHDLTEKLCRRFDKKKIYLAGHSWGSVIGVLTVNRFPELFYAYVGIAQVVDMVRGEQLSYNWTLEQASKANHKGIVKKLTEMGVPPYSGDWQGKTITQRRLLGKYGGELYGSKAGAFPLVVGSLLRNTEYTLCDKVNFFRGIMGSMRLLWPELMTINLMEQAPELNVPVCFMLGRHDFEVPSVLSEQYFNMLKAPKEELFWFENSAHMLSVEENDKFNSLLIDHIVPATLTDC